MSDYYYYTLYIPERFVTTEVAQIVASSLSFGIEKDDVTIDKIFNNEGEGILECIGEETKWKEMIDVETKLANLGIPFNAHSGFEYDTPPYDRYFRPGWKQSRMIPLTVSNESYLLVNDIKKALEAKTHQELIDKLNDLFDKQTTINIPKLANYVHETPLGQNKTAMERIDEVLVELDAGIVDHKTAFEKIKQIREDEDQPLQQKIDEVKEKIGEEFKNA